MQSLLDDLVDGKRVFGTVLRVEDEGGATVFAGAAGNLALQDQYFLASTTKLYTTALILKLRAEGALRLEDPVVAYADPGPLGGTEVTVRHLLTHRSGYPDYFSGALARRLKAGQDRAWTFDQALAMAGRPGRPGRKAVYADTNYQLLGRIVERLRGESFEEVAAKELFAPLGLTRTEMWSGAPTARPVPLYHKDRPLMIPLAMASFRADGGIVSTAAESMAFLRAFFDGTFFPRAYVPELLAERHRIMFPLAYGVGVMRFRLPRAMTLFRDVPELVGHSGLSGAFAYHCPAKGLYLTGTVNQIAEPSISYRLLTRVLISTTAR